MIKVAIIGAGNVATHLAQNFKKNGVKIHSIFSRSRDSAAILAKKVQCKSASYYNFENQELDVLIVAVNDDSIKKVLNKIKVNSKTIVVHTSGSVTLEIFDDLFENFGSFYPLQTFSIDVDIEMAEVPFLIEGNSSEVQKQLLELGNLISKNVQLITSEQRKKLHLAAVFANNFTNTMLAISEEILEENNLDKSILIPLVEETIKKAKAIGAKDAQTGPAIRNDQKTMQNHIELLKNKPNIKALYQLISKIIIENN